MKFLAISLYIYITSLLHAGSIAEYQYSLENEELTLRFVIEKEELHHFKFNDDCNIKQMTALCISTYIANNSFIEINDKKMVFELQNSYTEKDHLIVLLKGTKLVTSVEKITVSNNCFYEFNKKFKNRIILNVEQFQKSYLLTKNKNSLCLN
jgi:hypothetical protein